MSDLISRQAAIDIERNATVDTNPSHFEAHQKFTQFMDDAEISSFGRWQWSNGFNTALTAVGIDLKKLPSAQPEQRWIPVTERLPEEYGEYICTMENRQVQECGFVPENQRGLVDGWSTCEADGHKFLGYADVLAWMPLPEPYRGEGEADD